MRWRTLCSSLPVRFLLFSGLGCLGLVIAGALVLGVGLFDTYVGYILTWMGFADDVPLHYLCNLSNLFSAFICGAFGIFDCVVTAVGLCIGSVVVCLPILTLVECKKWYHRRKCRTVDVEEDYYTTEFF